MLVAYRIYRGTNNEAERTLRGPAQARDAGRTNKTLVGARRQSIIVSVLESLRLYLPTFTLSKVTAEIKRWVNAGRSCFADLLRNLNLALAKMPVLDRIYPHPSDSISCSQSPPRIAHERPKGQRASRPIDDEFDSTRSPRLPAMRGRAQPCASQEDRPSSQPRQLQHTPALAW